MTRLETTTTTHVARYWLPVLAYVALITTLSHQPHLNPPPVPFFSSDKIAHIAEYLVLGVLLSRAFRATLTGSRPLAIALVALSSGIVVGALDEFHQSFIPGRDSSAYDVLADTAGVTLAQAWFLARARS